MELIAQINGAVNSFVWGAPMLILLIGVGILMTGIRGCSSGNSATP